MSIATTENRATRQALDAWHAEQDALAVAENQVNEEISIAFGKLLPAGWAAKSIAVPSVTYAAGVIGEGLTTADEVIRERMEGGYCHAELLAVLEKSQCPLVQALREAIGSSWAKSYASDIAPFRAGAA